MVGGGLELASSCHIRVADDTAFFAEGSRSIFVGGGGPVRIPRSWIGAHRMLDMMLTGRVYKGCRGVPLGFAQVSRACRAGTRQGHRVRRTHRDQRADDQLLADARTAAYRRTASRPRLPDGRPDFSHRAERTGAKARVREFLEGRGPKVKA